MRLTLAALIKRGRLFDSLKMIAWQRYENEYDRQTLAGRLNDEATRTAYEPLLKYFPPTLRKTIGKPKRCPRKKPSK